MVRPKKQIKVKEPVRLREKKLRDGNRSLYLDIYHRGTRKYEYLKLYLVPETTPEAKTRNKETMRVAEQIKSERILQLQSRGLTQWDSIKKASLPVLTWMEQEYENPPRPLSVSTMNWRKQTRKTFANYLDSIHRPTLTLEEIDKDICRGFIAYLRTAPNRLKKEAHTISQGTGERYMTEIICMLNYAVREGLIATNPFKQIPSNERLTCNDNEREFLTIEEIKLLMDAPCPRDEVKQAFMFPCFTGLRISDVRRLAPMHILKSADGLTEYIDIEMQKTKHGVIVPLSEEAKKWLPSPKGNDIPFFSLPTLATINHAIAKWTKNAGIEKHATYHTSRHSFATMMLTIGADIYTTSKLLGHSHVSTTEIYAKVIDKKKVESISSLDKMFNQQNTERV